MTCPNCGTENAPGAKFCSECGSPLAAAAPAREERKVVSVVFCDVVGSTARAESADPEDVRAALNAFYAHVREDLERFGGTVEKFIGDAVMAVFGAPVSHEDDAERAVRAALAIRDWAREDGGLQVRIAVNTGEALVALGARAEAGEALVAGDVVNTAARLQSAAPENGVLVGETTHRATRETIEYEAVDDVQAKGKSEPVAAWLAVEARGRVAVELAERATPLVGRERERDLLLSAFGRARDDRSTELVTVVGVPGIGKSRLVAELYAELEAEAELTRWRHGRSLPYGEGLAFWALAEMVRAEAGIRDTDSSAEAGRKLAGAVAAVVAADDADWVEARLRPLVGLDAGEVSREESFGAWRRFLEALAEQRPTVLVFEDLHWAGDDLLDFVDALADWVTDVPLLIVATARPELIDRRPGWAGGKRNAHTVSLAPLDEDETARLLVSLLDRHLLPADIQQELLARAGGNPLYAEQFVRMLEERGGLSADLPDSVQAIIAARLDSLPEDEKRLLLDAAVLGRTFWAGALAGYERTEELLRALQRKEFVRRERRSTVGGEDEFSFAHLLVRDVAYAQMPRQQRAEKHAHAARWIESLSADRSEDISELLAYHYLAALELGRAAGVEQPELVEPATAALIEATERALALSALAQARRYASTSLDLLGDDDPRRARALFQLARAEFVLGGMDAVALGEQAVARFLAVGDAESAAAVEVEAANWLWNAGRRDDAHSATEHALDLVAGAPPSRVKAAALVERARLLMIAGRMAESTEGGLAGLELAEQFGDERLQARALITLGAARDSEADLRRGIAIADRADAFTEFLRGKNNLGEALIQRGELTEVEELYAEAADRIGRVGWVSGLAWIDAQRLTLRYMSGDWPTAEQLLARFSAYLETGGPHVLEFEAWWLRALFAQARGDLEAAAACWDRSLELARVVKDSQSLAPPLCGRARLLLDQGRGDEATAHVDEILTFVDEEGRATYYTWLIDLGWLLHDLGRAEEFPPALHEGIWADVGSAVATGHFAAAADLLGASDFRTDEAYARLRLAERLADEGRLAEAAAQRDRALAFYREVGATAYVRRGEALLAETA
jgi:class 3 adenylate cyclase/tetratricopeptide (TPR) repeat protein